MTTMLEHVNITVSDPNATARLLCQLFDWRIRWEGASIHGGRTVHVGTDSQYLAVYSMPQSKPVDQASYEQVGGLNHIGVQVDDLETAERRVVDAGFEPFNHADYAPGRRFYFRDENNIEFEVLSYSGEMS